MKTENAEKVIQILEKSIDAEKGFKTAFKNATDRSLKNYYFEKSKQRASFIRTLETEISKFNSNIIASNGSITGDLHRTWMDLKSLVSANTDEAMIEETLRGEKAAKEEFETVLDEEYLPLELRTILRKQLSTITDDLKTIKTLEDIQQHFY